MGRHKTEPWKLYNLTPAQYYYRSRKGELEIQSCGERFSKRSYKNSKEKLDKLKEKYKNGITKEIMDEWMEDMKNGC